MVGHPFDLVKVRLQTEGSSGRFRGGLHCVVETVRNEGVISLYKGVTPPLLGTGVINALVFGLQGMFVHQVKEWDGTEPDTPASLNQTCRAAVLTGAIISLVVTPIEGIKSRLQVQYHSLGKKAASAAANHVAASSVVATAAAVSPSPAPLYTGPRSCVSYVLRTQGFLGIYRGFLPVMFCRMSNYAYFGAYEFWKTVYARYIQPGGVVGRSGSNGAVPTKVAAVFSGGMAGITYWFSCFPMDVVKARMMSIHTADTRTVRSTARWILAKEGWRGFGLGFWPCLARAFPANAAAFLAFESTMAILPDRLKW